MNFWKANLLIGIMGVCLLVIAFFTGHYSILAYNNYETTKKIHEFTPYALTLVTDDKVAYLGICGFACLSWQIITTFIGLAWHALDFLAISRGR